MTAAPPSPPPTPSRSGLLLACALATLAALIWSGNWVVVRAVRADVPPLGLNFWRWTAAALALAPFALRPALRDWPAARRDWRIVLALGALGAAIFHAMINTGLRATEAVNALLLNLTAPVIIVTLSWLWFRDRISRRQGLGVALALAGGVALAARGDLAALGALAVNPGDLWIMAAMLVWGAYSVLLKRRPGGIGGVSLLFYMSVTGVLLMAPAYAWETFVAGRPMALSAPTAIAVGYTGLCASVLAFLAYNGAVARLGPNAAGFFLLLMPVFGAALAIPLLGERLAPYHLVAFALVLLGVLCAILPGRRG